VIGRTDGDQEIAEYVHAGYTSRSYVKSVSNPVVVVHLKVKVLELTAPEIGLLPSRVSIVAVPLALSYVNRSLVGVTVI
jgi:hypothetical protein